MYPALFGRVNQRKEKKTRPGVLIKLLIGADLLMFVLISLLLPLLAGEPVL
jgi:hypothetical protein